MRRVSCALVLGLAAPALAQVGSTVGTLRGHVDDTGGKSAAAGATVIATSPALQGQQTVLTDENGQYFLTSLPPGFYTLTIIYADRTFACTNIIVQIGKEVVVNVAVDSNAPKVGKGGEIIELSGSAPIVDQGSTKLGRTFTDDFTRNVPTARTIGGVTGAAGGAQSDLYGVSLSGATSVENTYIVEGLNTTDTGFGGLSSDLPTEFIDQAEVITGGYNAEFGRATGGVINVVTKRGSNQWHGSVFGYYRPSALVADAVTVQQEGGSIDSSDKLDYNLDTGAELGGPIIRDKLWFHVGLNPSFTHRTTTRKVQSQVDENDDGLPDRDGRGFTRRELVSSSDIPASFRTMFFTGKLNGAISPQHQFQISTWGNPRTANDLFGVQRAPDVTHWSYDDGAYDAAAKWTSKFGERTQVDGVFGYHRGYSRQRPDTAAGGLSQVTYEYERSLQDFADLESGLSSATATCEDGGGGDKWAKIRNCPVTSYVDQGLGYLEERTNTRRTAVVSVTHRVKAGGYHILKGGLEVESSTYDSRKQITGGTVLVRTGPGLDGAWLEESLVSVGRPLTDDERMRLGNADAADDPVFETDEIPCAGGRALCKRTKALVAETTDRGLAGYLQDSWQIRPNLTLDVGVRYEQQVGYVADRIQGTITPEGEVVPERAFTLDNEWSPRVGLIFDPTSEGRAKLFAHAGRYYENVPMDISVRNFGGEINNFELANANVRTPTTPGYDPSCNLDHGSADLGPTLDKCRDRALLFTASNGVAYVAPDMHGQYTQELVAGAEYEVSSGFKLGASVMHRSLPSVIEDMSTDGGASFLIGNPGANYDSSARDLDALSKRTLTAAGCASLEDASPGCDSQQQALAQLQKSRADQLRAVKKLEKPIRDYDAVQLTATQRPSKRSLVVASYTYSRSVGNYPGLFSTETGQLDPNMTSMFDLPDLMANRYGKLGLDRPHNLKLDGFYAFDFAKAGTATVGASLRAQSGVAHNALAAHPLYGQGEAYLLPRGTAGRSPITTQADLHLAYARAVSNKVTVEGFVNVFNVFDRQDELSTDEIYTIDSANPVVGGELSDLAHVKRFDDNRHETNQTITKNPNFGRTGNNSASLPSSGQSPVQASRNVQLGFRVTW